MPSNRHGEAVLNSTVTRHIETQEQAWIVLSKRTAESYKDLSRALWTKFLRTICGRRTETPSHQKTSLSLISPSALPAPEHFKGTGLLFKLCMIQFKNLGIPKSKTWARERPNIYDKILRK